MCRRHIVTAWNPAELDKTALPPCHWAFEIIVRPTSMQQKMKLSGGDMVYLDGLWEAAYLKNDKEAMKILQNEVAGVPDHGFILKWHQRSVDTFLGLPFNIASYGLLANIIGHLTGIQPLSLIGDLSNVHIYEPHLDAAKKQLHNSVLAHDGCQLKVSERFLNDVSTYKKGEITFTQFINQLEVEDFQLPGYTSFKTIKAEMIAPKQ
jgi:thymidylate synthase